MVHWEKGDELSTPMISSLSDYADTAKLGNDAIVDETTPKLRERKPRLLLIETADQGDTDKNNQPCEKFSFLARYVVF